MNNNRWQTTFLLMAMSTGVILPVTWTPTLNDPEMTHFATVARIESSYVIMKAKVHDGPSYKFKVISPDAPTTVQKLSLEYLKSIQFAIRVLGEELHSDHAILVAPSQTQPSQVNAYIYENVDKNLFYGVNGNSKLPLAPCKALNLSDFQTSTNFQVLIKGAQSLVLLSDTCTANVKEILDRAIAARCNELNRAEQNLLLKILETESLNPAFGNIVADLCRVDRSKAIASLQPASASSSAHSAFAGITTSDVTPPHTGAKVRLPGHDNRCDLYAGRLHNGLLQLRQFPNVSKGANFPFCIEHNGTLRAAFENQAYDGMFFTMLGDFPGCINTNHARIRSGELTYHTTDHLYKFARCVIADKGEHINIIKEGTTTYIHPGVDPNSRQLILDNWPQEGEVSEIRFCTVNGKVHYHFVLSPTDTTGELDATARSSTEARAAAESA